MLEHSPATDPRRGWQAEVIDYRDQLDRALTGTLTNHLTARLDAVYDRALWTVRRKMAIYGEDAAAKTLPTARPYTLEQVLDPDWWPPAPGA